MDARQLPPLTALRAFEAAARHLSFKHAAAELSLTPTAISHQVRQLEDRLGVRLFVRGTRRVDLTEAGQSLYPALRDGFDGIARALQLVRPNARPRALVLSTTVAFASRWLLPRLAGFAARQHGIALHLHTSDEVVDLAGGTAQLAIRYGHGRYPGMRSVPLLPSRFAPVCAPRLGVHGPDDLAKVPLIGFEWQRREADTPDWPLWFERAGRSPVERQLQFSDEGHAIQAAIAGQGVALANLALVADELRAGLLCQPFGPQLDGLGFHLVWTVGNDADPDIAAVHAWLLDEARG
ncbi:LysR substrate-binding domain-containing protein [Montanilutibacter psychrotolerans]|uniref:LysR family transcriptional regulator n=1 Tax=Montanilutibacter psychrotolerans TaxID=1327343 RepID=A0A3M8T5D4_9GAMM|nr:LysR substrate-binding domain-containing protein [Lysobacter psychrotolerans]RNF86410.1 LysR family transcriptional regulator [Lysobacter psychrotolerans]